MGARTAAAAVLVLVLASVVFLATSSREEEEEEDEKGVAVKERRSGSPVAEREHALTREEARANASKMYLLGSREPDTTVAQGYMEHAALAGHRKAVMWLAALHAIAGRTEEASSLARYATFKDVDDGSLQANGDTRKALEIMRRVDPVAARNAQKEWSENSRDGRLEIISKAGAEATNVMVPALGVVARQLRRASTAAVAEAAAAEEVRRNGATWQPLPHPTAATCRHAPPPPRQPCDAAAAAAQRRATGRRCPAPPPQPPLPL